MNDELLNMLDITAKSNPIRISDLPQLGLAEFSHIVDLSNQIYRGLRARWSQEAANDLRVVHGIAVSMSSYDDFGILNCEASNLPWEGSMALASKPWRETGL